MRTLPTVVAKLVRPRSLDAGRYTLAVTIAERLDSLGIELPPPFPPAGNYLSCVIDEGLVYVGGHGPVAGDQMIRGKVGSDLTLEQGRDAARMTALSILATLQAELGDLDRIQRIIKVFGMVNVAPGFDQTPAVLDGCSTCWSRSSATPVAIPAQRSASPSCQSASPSRSSSSPGSVPEHTVTTVLCRSSTPLSGGVVHEPPVQLGREAVNLPG